MLMKWLIPPNRMSRMLLDVDRKKTLGGKIIPLQLLQVQQGEKDYFHKFLIFSASIFRTIFLPSMGVTENT